MSFLKKIKKVVNYFDMFYSSQLLRFDSDTQYKTLTGGLLSLIIIVVIIIGFANMISQTLQMTSITSSLTSMKLSDPPLFYLQPGKQKMYALGIAIQSIDISFTADLYNGPQYFQLKPYLIKIQNGVPIYSSISLQQCSRQHFSMMPQFNQYYDSFQLNKYACLPLNHSYPIQGMYTSYLTYELQIDLFRCINSTQNNNNCASQEQIDALFDKYTNFIFSFNYVNPVINPSLKEYMSYYVQGNDYVLFSKDFGSQAWVYYSDYQIQSDNSIWPFTQTTTQSGILVETKATAHPFGVTKNSPLASLFLAKSPNSLKYTRQVQKISAVFSYIGGLVGAVTAALFFVNIYTDCSLEVTIGLNLFQEKQLEKSQDGEHFNFIGFVRLTCYQFLRLVGWSGSWNIPQRFEKYQEEAVKQLDVQILLKRLIKLQACMVYLFSEEQLKQIKEGSSITVGKAQRMRSLLIKDEKKSPKNSSKVMNLQNQLQDKRKSPQIEANSYILSAQSMIHKNINPQENICKMQNIESDQQNNNQSIDIHERSQSLFGKLKELKERRKFRKATNE